MLICTDEHGNILWIQLNPDNTLTKIYFDPGEREKFDPSLYKEVKRVA
jgi:ubiquinone biosynthesis protein Coq4